MMQFFPCTFCVPLHFDSLAERFGDRVEIDHLSFMGNVPTEWRLNDENGHVRLHIFDDDSDGWMPGIAGRQSEPIHDLQVHAPGRVSGISAKGLWMETRGIGDAKVCVMLRMGTYREPQEPLPVLQSKSRATTSSPETRRPDSAPEQKAAYLAARTAWSRGGKVGCSPDTVPFGVFITDFTSTEICAADDAGDPMPEGVSSWTWCDPSFTDQLRWHHAIRKASKGGIVFTRDERIQAEVFYADTALVLSF